MPVRLCVLRVVIVCVLACPLVIVHHRRACIRACRVSLSCVHVYLPACRRLSSLCVRACLPACHLHHQACLAVALLLLSPPSSSSSGLVQGERDEQEQAKSTQKKSTRTNRHNVVLDHVQILSHIVLIPIIAPVAQVVVALCCV